jgi:hypothetical protein
MVSTGRMNGRHYNASSLEIRNLIEVRLFAVWWMFVRSCERFKRDRRSVIARVLPCVQHVHHGDPQTCFEKPVPWISRDAPGRHRSVSGTHCGPTTLTSIRFGGLPITLCTTHTFISSQCRVLSFLEHHQTGIQYMKQLRAASGVCAYWRITCPPQT